MISRKEQIFAPTKTIGGKRKLIKEKAPTEITVNSILNQEFKGEVTNTILKSCSFKSGTNIHTINNPKIRSIYKNKKQPYCFVITGDETIADEANIMEGLPKDFLADLKGIKTTDTEAKIGHPECCDDKHLCSNN